jgi:hypothetical protein
MSNLIRKNQHAININSGVLTTFDAVSGKLLTDC